MSSSREHVANEGTDAQDRARQFGGESSSDETEVQITQRPARRDCYRNLYVPLNQRWDVPVPVPILWWLDPEMKFNRVQGPLLSFDKRRISKMRPVWPVGRDVEMRALKDDKDVTRLGDDEALIYPLTFSWGLIDLVIKSDSYSSTSANWNG